MAFHDYTRPFLQNRPEIQALEWLPLIEYSKRLAFENSIREQGHSEFQITERDQHGRLVPASQRDEYLPVTWLEPYVGNEAALGFDVASNPARTKAFHLARDSGEAVASGKITLVQEKQQQSGILVFLPVYDHVLPLGSVAKKRMHLIGIFLGVFRIGDVMNAVISNTPSMGMDIHLFDVTNPETPDLLYTNSPETMPDLGGYTNLNEINNAPLTSITNIQIPGRRWSLVYKANSVFASSTAEATWLIPASGCLFVALLGGFLLILTGRNELVERLVGQQTKELRQGNEQLAQEIAERVQAQQQREELIQQLETKNTELERFTYTVSHDLKSPIVTIHGFLGFLEKDISARNHKRIKDDIQRISAAATHMNRLLDELLELSRIDYQTINPQWFSMTEVMHEVVESLKTIIEKHKVQIVADPEITDVYGDSSAFRAVVQNLIENALKFSGNQRDPSIILGAQKQGNETVFFVKDNGIGIDPRYQNKIFGLFERLSPDIEGTGLGLAIAKRVVDKHNGHLWVESEGVNKGSTFFFTVDLKVKHTDQT